jgi:hypothetical protein
MTKLAATRIVETSPQTMWRIEDGTKAKVPEVWINAWCNAWGCTDAEHQLLLSLAQQLRATQKSWWRAYAQDIPSDFTYYLSLEDSASHLTIWTISLIPGLLQTPGYRSALAQAENPNWTPSEIARRVEVATKRQQLLQNPDLTVEVLLSEAVLYTLAGSDAVQFEQLLRLLELGDLPNVVIRIVPFHAVNSLQPQVTPFVLLDFPELSATEFIDPSVVYVEGFAKDLYLDQEDQVTRYRDAADRIRQAAWDTTETKEIIMAVARKYGLAL